VTSSVSGNAMGRSCFRILVLSCCAWSTLVHWCPSPSAAIVTQLVTRLRARGQTDPFLVRYVQVVPYGRPPEPLSLSCPVPFAERGHRCGRGGHCPGGLGGARSGRDPPDSIVTGALFSASLTAASAGVHRCRWRLLLTWWRVPASLRSALPPLRQALT
jgi:hypothetical protein